MLRMETITTQEYFERTQKIWFLDAETDIATTCITYLLFDNFESSFCLTNEEFEERLQLNPLYVYAARNWGYHALGAPTVEHLIIGFLESEAKASASSQAMMASKSHWSRSDSAVVGNKEKAHAL